MNLPSIVTRPAEGRGRSSGAIALAPGIERWLALLAILLLALVWFVPLGGRTLVGPDEGRYATLAWEMVRSGDWVTPRLNGLLYFEKPPLQYWLGAIFFHLFGLNAFAARLWPALASFLTVLAVGYTGARLWGRETGLRCLGVAAAMTWIFANGHFLTLDAGLTFFLTVSLCAVLVARFADPAPASARHWIWLAWAAMAGAVLSKGLVGILIPGAVLVIASLWRRDARLWRGMHWASGLAILLLLAAPWFVLVSMRNPGFAEFFFVHEHFARYLTTEHNRVGAWWYYLPLFVLGMLPWTGALPWLWPRAGTAPKAFGERGRLGAADLLLVWPAFVLLFFSASGSKLPSYILPMFPALALLIGLRLRDASNTALRRHLLVPVLVWLLALAGASLMARAATPWTPVEVLRPMGTGLRIGAVVFLAGAAFAWRSLSRGQVTAAVLGLALGHVIAVAIVLQSQDAFGRLKSTSSMAATLEPLIDADTPIFAVREYDQTLPFYLGRDLTLVDYEDEFSLGEAAEPERYIPTLDAFVERWQALPQAAAYMDFPTYLELQQRKLPMRAIYTSSRRVMVVKK